MIMRRKKHFQGGLLIYLNLFIYLCIYLLGKERLVSYIIVNESYLLSDVAACNLKAESKEKVV